MHRNWHVLCQFSAKNQLLVHLLATVDLNTDIGKRLVKEFNECFCSEPMAEPIPLSLLIREHARRASGECSESDGQSAYGALLTLYGVLDEYNIPCIYFWRGERSKREPNLLALPSTINVESQTGDIVEFEGAKFVVVDNSDGIDELAISPLELIDVNS